MISTETNAVGSIKTRDMDAHGVKWSEASRVSSADFCLHEFCCFFAISFLFWCQLKELMAIEISLNVNYSFHISSIFGIWIPDYGPPILMDKYKVLFWSLCQAVHFYHNFSFKPSCLFRANTSGEILLKLLDFWVIWLPKHIEMWLFWATMKNPELVNWFDWAYQAHFSLHT